MKVPLRPPTSIEVQTNSLYREGGRNYMAVFYPQIGGYHGYAWVELHACGTTGGDSPPRDNDGFNVHLFHDGSFPTHHEAKETMTLHHCSADQFIEFGELIKKKMALR